MITAKSQKKAYLFALLAVLFWSTMSSAFKITLRHIAFDQMLFWASLVGVVTLLVINQAGPKRIKLHKLTIANWISSAIMGLFNPFLYYLVLFKAYDLLEAQIAGTLNYAWPVVLVLLSIPFLKQKISTMSVVAILVSFLGVAIISLQGNYRELKIMNPLGVVLAVASAFFWAIYWIMNMKDPREETGKILLNLVFGTVYISIFLLLTGGIHLPTGKALAGTVYIGMFEMSITFVIWLKALQLSENTARVSNLIYLSPFIALFIIRLAVGEKIHLTTVAGLIFIVAGIVFQQIIANRQMKKPGT
ncbi:MAG: DMT family transporter [Chlorobi bacterium]|nr:DMT family transporter [Chlorobiota bacterium]